MDDSFLKFIALIGIVLAIVHLTTWAYFKYDIIYFFLGLGVIYLFVPITKKLKRFEEEQES
ncbi:hypothetical protein KY330_02230 [Candidatus Woesearchaeota archaeon]|nr:hypothetical protein [Candidatus Woesearchaeota archaeon]